MKVTKAVVAVAGWGTRMLPITKSIEKCMLPVGTRPVVDYVVQDLLKAGIEDIYFIVGEQSSQIQSFYHSNVQLNDYLRSRGKEHLLEMIEPLQGVNVHYVTQPLNNGYGTSIPVGLASRYVRNDESVLVIMGDQFFYRTDDGSNAADLVRLAEDSGVSAALFGNEVPFEDVSKFGIIEKDEQGHFVQILEKPAPEDAPSNLNNSSFYLFDKELFELARTLPVNPQRGEFEVTDAINAYVASGKKIAVGTVAGEYMECGSVDGWLKANEIIIRGLTQ